MPTQKSDSKEVHDIINSAVTVVVIIARTQEAC